MGRKDPGFSWAVCRITWLKATAKQGEQVKEEVLVRITEQVVNMLHSNSKTLLGYYHVLATWH